MNKLRLYLFLFFLPLYAWASIDVGPLLNKVTLQLQAEQWVTTKTALVTVGVNAAVADQDIGQIQADVMVPGMMGPSNLVQAGYCKARIAQPSASIRQ